MSDVSIALERDQISRCEKPIRPYVRCTSIMEINGADVGVNSRSLSQPQTGERVGAIISGGNTTAVNFDQ